MKTEKKFFLQKDDEIDSIVDQFLNTPASKIILNIPKNSVLGNSVHNFQVLKREVETAGKEIVVESIDEHILELASLSGMPAVNPVFRTKERAVTDIMPKALSQKENGKEEEVAEGEAEYPEEDKKSKLKSKISLKKEKKREEIKEEKISKEESEYPFSEKIPKEERPVRKKNKKIKILVYGGSFVVVLGGVFALLTYVLPHVTIELSIKKTTSPFNDSVMVSVNAASSSFSGTTIILPGQIIKANSNLSLHFDGGIKKDVESKATGTLVVYNDYSSSPQTLVQTTRFLSPEGKIFRSTKKVVIPGAKVLKGVLTPSSTTVPVIADEAGVDYNVGPSVGWKIPGFEGTPRYDKFYAEALFPMRGGFSGSEIVPNDSDLSSAKDEAGQKLNGVLENQISLLAADNFKSLPGSANFEITNENVTGSSSGSGYDVFIEGTMSEFVFDESMLQKAIVSSLGSSYGSDVKVDDFNVSYSTSTPDFSGGKMVFNASGTVVYEPNIDVGKIKGDISGQTSDGLKATIFSLPGLESANVSFWPFWVNEVPKNTSNINIKVQ